MVSLSLAEPRLATVILGAGVDLEQLQYVNNLSHNHKHVDELASLFVHVIA